MTCVTCKAHNIEFVVEVSSTSVTCLIRIFSKVIG